MNMIALDVVRQAIENNASKPVINSKIMKKLAISKINTGIKIDCDWQLRDNITSIMSAKISDEEKNKLISELSKVAYDSYKEMKQEVEELFGAEKQASVEADKQSGEKEEIAKAPEGSSSEEAQDDPKDEKKTPAEHVVEQKPGQAMFNY